MAPVSRRRALQAVSGLVAGLAGCSALSGDSDSVPVPTAWTSDVRRPTRGFRVSDGPLVAGSASPWPDDNGMFGIDPSSGDERWAVTAGDREGSSAVARAGETAFGYTTNGTVRAVDGTDGTVEWATDERFWDLPGREVHLHAPLVVDGAVVVPASWEHDDADDRLIGFDAASGDELWRYALDAPLSGAPAAGDGAVVVPRTDGVLEAVDVAGDRLWRTERPDSFQSAAVTDGRVFVGTAAERFEVFDLASGAFQWAFGTENAVLTRPRLVDGVVYVGSADYYLYAVDAESGERLWRTETVNAVTSGPVEVGDALVSVVGGWNDGPVGDRRYNHSPEAVCVHGAAGGDLREEYVYDDYYDQGSPQWVANLDGAAYVGHERGLVKLDGGALDD